MRDDWRRAERLVVRVLVVRIAGEDAIGGQDAVEQCCHHPVHVAIGRGHSRTIGDTRLSCPTPVSPWTSGEAFGGTEAGEEIGRHEAGHVRGGDRFQPRHANRVWMRAHLIGEHRLEFGRKVVPRPAVEHRADQRGVERFAARAAHVERDAAVGVAGLSALVARERVEACIAMQSQMFATRSLSIP